MSDFEYGLDLRKFVCNYAEKLLSLKLTFFANTLLYQSTAVFHTYILHRRQRGILDSTL